jgi:hypothetical protein
MRRRQPRPGMIRPAPGEKRGRLARSTRLSGSFSRWKRKTSISKSSQSVACSQDGYDGDLLMSRGALVEERCASAGCPGVRRTKETMAKPLSSMNMSEAVRREAFFGPGPVPLDPSPDLDLVPLERSLVLPAQPARSHGRGLRFDPPFPLPSMHRLPASNASPGDAQHPRYVDKLISLGEKGGCSMRWSA